MTNETNDNCTQCCGVCQHFFDEWLDGTGKCARAHGGITHADSGTDCSCFEDYEYTTDYDDEDEL